jgi:hypothetical protein
VWSGCNTVISYGGPCCWEGLGNVEVILVRLALVGVLTFSPADFNVHFGISLAFSAGDITHGLSPPIFRILIIIYH